MRIAFSALSAQAGGGISSLINLAPVIARSDPSNEYLVFVGARQKEILGRLRGRVRVVQVPGIVGRTGLRMLWEQLALPFHLLARRVGILYSTGNVTSLAAPCRVMLLLENSNPYSLLPIRWTRIQRMRSIGLRALAWMSVRRAQRVRFLSENSGQILRRRLHLPRAKCVTIPHGVAKAERTVRAPRVDGGFILTVSVVAPHKNMEVLLRAFAVLSADGSYPGRLAIVGDCCYPHYTRRLQGLVQALALTGKVLFVGNVAHADIGGWYAAAELYVQTSIEETFGLPVLEALSHGRPVIAPDTRRGEAARLFLPYRELYGDHCWYYDPFDSQALARLMQQALADDGLRRRAAAEGVRLADRFSWERTAAGLIRTFADMGVVHRA
jgi:glycosyltransferase involved in cell wall biosynthesis